jgi:histidinol-phosphate aminotransferase
MIRVAAAVDGVVPAADNAARATRRSQLKPSERFESRMSLFRSAIDAIDGYTPGEQPQEGGWVKLNTNENPYPPSPRVVAALEAAARGRLNVYPDPLARRFRESAAKLFEVDPDWILPANGSDENLTILTRSFADAGDLVASPYPSYVLYETLAGIQGARHERLVLNRDWSFTEAARRTATRAKLVFVPNPNSPSAHRWATDDVLALVPPRGVLVLDEAYGDFCDEPHRGEIVRGSTSTDEPAGRVVVTRTLSKSYSLAGVRFGFAVARPELIAGMRKVKDSYNCDGLSLAAATAAIEDQDWMRENVARIRRTRERLERELRPLGFETVPSQTNFIWATRPDGGHRAVYEGLKRRRVLVRYMRFTGAFSDADANASAAGNSDPVYDGLRITIGTDAEIDRLLEALREVLTEGIVERAL